VIYLDFEDIIRNFITYYDNPGKKELPMDGRKGQTIFMVATTTESDLIMKINVFTPNDLLMYLTGIIFRFTLILVRITI